MSEPGWVTESELTHRLKNHLCVIVGFCELLLADASGDDPRRADLEDIRKAAQDAIEMMPEIARRLADRGASTD